MDFRPPGSSVYGILQARILEWVAMPFSRGSSLPRDRTWVSCIAGRSFTVWATREAPKYKSTIFFFLLLKDKLLWKRPLGQQIQWWLFAKLLLDLFPPPPGETEWTNHLYVSVNCGNLLKTWLTCEADFSQVPVLSGRWALSLRCHLYFARLFKSTRLLVCHSEEGLLQTLGQQESPWQVDPSFAVAKTKLNFQREFHS